jgi:putative membrane protein
MAASQAMVAGTEASITNEVRRMNPGNWGPLANSVLFSAVGVVFYVVGFFVLDKVTPYNLWREICEKQNVALSILVGSMAIGLALIIAAAIHG